MIHENQDYGLKSACFQEKESFLNSMGGADHKHGPEKSGLGGKIGCETVWNSC